MLIINVNYVKQDGTIDNVKNEQLLRQMNEQPHLTTHILFNDITDSVIGIGPKVEIDWNGSNIDIFERVDAEKIIDAKTTDFEVNSIYVSNDDEMELLYIWLDNIIPLTTRELKVLFIDFYCETINNVIIFDTLSIISRKIKK